METIENYVSKLSKFIIQRPDVMNLVGYRNSPPEKQRTEDLIRLFHHISSVDRVEVLDIGARDGYFSRLLSKYFESVTALDLVKPSIPSIKNVFCVQGDVTKLKFRDKSFDLVFCTEVLEHIPSHLLGDACGELSRVSRKFLLIGVPYKQDIRVGRTTCYSCGNQNPPWGHINKFTKKRLINLFRQFNVLDVVFSGKTYAVTNPIATFFMDLAGNPYGTYTQQEHCIHCGKKLKLPPERTFPQKVSTKTAHYTNKFQNLFCNGHPNWIHILFQKIKS